jgi:fucose 4-O-acetylase-like acetyltransferase
MSGDRAMEGNSISYQKKPRIMWIDIMRGLLMFWVIFGHITEDKAQIVYIYSFHMPAYFS